MQIVKNKTRITKADKLAISKNIELLKKLNGVTYEINLWNAVPLDEIFINQSAPYAFIVKYGGKNHLLTSNHAKEVFKIYHRLGRISKHKDNINKLNYYYRIKNQKIHRSVYAEFSWLKNENISGKLTEYKRSALVLEKIKKYNLTLEKLLS